MQISKPIIIGISGSVKLQVQNNCCVCGKNFWYRTNVDLMSEPPKGVLQECTRLLGMPDIPEGWSMSGRQHITCPDCGSNSVLS